MTGWNSNYSGCYSKRNSSEKTNSTMTDYWNSRTDSTKNSTTGWNYWTNLRTTGSTRNSNSMNWIRNYY
jgi:hypothetical protein